MVIGTQKSTNIRVKYTTKAEIEAQGVYGETIDDIINRMMFEYKENIIGKKQTHQPAKV